VYTLPPNQAVSIERQKIINQNRSQIPEYRDTKKIILKKSKSLKKNLDQELIERLKKI
jgi:methyltransferase DNA modification enzyme